MKGEFIMDMTRKHIGRAVALFLLALCAFMPETVKAQINPRAYYQIGWQFDFPISSGFNDKMNDLGLYMEAGYYLTPHISLGGFANINTRSNYVPRQTFTEGSSSVTTDQVRSFIQVPFGASLRYRFAWRSRWQPYIGAKLGANYAEAESAQQVYAYSDKSWGVYVSPEVGINFYPFKQKYVGFNLAAYYSYASNHGKVFYANMDGMNNFGIRIGLAF